MDTLLAAAPVLVVLVLMVGRGWTAAGAGAVTAALTVVLAVGVFDFGGAGDPFGVPTGVLGVLAEAGFIAQMALVDASARELARATAAYHLVLGWILLAALVVLIGRSHPEQGPPWRWGALAGVLFFGPFGAIALWIGPELPTLGGALAGVVAFALVVRWRRPRASTDQLGTGPDDDGGGQMHVARAASPYLVLVGLVLATRLVPPVNDLLRQVEVQWRTGAGFSGSVRPLLHPALLLTIAFVTGAVAQRASWPVVGDAFWSATRRLGGVVVALVTMVTIARTMSHAGMTTELATGAATTGALWPVLAPAVGALGTFVTGSATASNVLFTELQETTAETAELPVTPLLGAQGFGAAVGNIICPHNIVAAAATVGITGQEGQVLRRTLPIAATYLVLGGVLALALTR